MWNVELYKKMLTRVAEEGNFNGKAVKNKEAVYKHLSKLLYVSYDTVKSWSRAKSTGPSDKSILNKMEEIFGVKLTIKDKEEEGSKIMSEERYSDFVKNNIKQCYELVMNFIQSEDVEDEKQYCEMRAKLKPMRVGIPETIYNKILDFVDTYLDPIIYSEDNIFSDMYTDEIGYYNEEHAFCMRNEEATFKFMGMFLDKMIELENKLEDFGMKELYPILVG